MHSLAAPRASPAGTSRLAPSSAAAGTATGQQQRGGSGGKAAAAAAARGQTKVSTFFPAIIDGSSSRDSEGGGSAGSAAAAERASAAAAAALHGGPHAHQSAMLLQHLQASSLARLSPVAETMHDEGAAQMQQALELREREIQTLKEQLRFVLYNGTSVNACLKPVCIQSSYACKVKDREVFLWACQACKYSLC